MNDQTVLFERIRDGLRAHGVSEEEAGDATIREIAELIGRREAQEALESDAFNAIHGSSGPGQANEFSSLTGNEQPERQAAEFISSLTGRMPTPDSVQQLLFFMRCIDIMLKRGYNPRGASWKRAGWRANLYEVLKRADRLWERSWAGSTLDMNNGIDIINYTAFYIRAYEEHPSEPWGKWGNPDEEE